MIRTHSLTFHVVRCDYCGYQSRSVADGFGSQEQAERDAIDHGWLMASETYHLCPECR